jgi:hypothetical protein
MRGAHALGRGIRRMRRHADTREIQILSLSLSLTHTHIHTTAFTFICLHSTHHWLEKLKTENYAFDLQSSRISSFLVVLCLQK